MIVEVTSAELIRTTVSLARSIWNSHYLPIIGQAQVDYMLQKFQSEKAITTQIEEGYRYHLVIHNDNAVGYAATLCKEAKLLLSKLYVSEAARGTGLGTTLLAHCKELAIQQQCCSVWLTVNRYNANSINWYRNKGFKVVEEKKFDIGNGYIMDDYILEATVEELLN